MRRNLLLLAAMFVFGAGVVAAQTKRQVVMFYNCENMYDTIRDESIHDEEFTPTSAKQWTSVKYWKKIGNLAKVFYSIASECRQYPAIIGLSEIENRNVLEDIVGAPQMQAANYQIVHYDGPDARGVDCALIYRPDVFKLEGSRSVTTIVEELPGFRTRDILAVWGTIDGERFMFIVCHWPSRLGGQAASEFKRIGAALTARRIIDNELAEHPETKVVFMGDLNDDPANKSISEALGGKLKISDTKGIFDMYNPFWQLHKDGYGTLAYGDAWNLFDNIIVSWSLVNGDGGYQIWKQRSNKYYGNIFKAPFMIQQTGQYKGYPLRTFVGDSFQNGFSDHFPVFIFIAK